MRCVVHRDWDGPGVIWWGIECRKCRWRAGLSGGVTHFFAVFLGFFLAAMG